MNQQHGFGDINPMDLFRQFFGGNQNPFQNRTTTRRKKGKELRIKLKITPEESYFGMEKTLKYDRRIKCVDCNGKAGQRKVCMHCHGTGVIEHVTGNSFFRNITRTTCNACGGKGYSLLTTCGGCNGEGLKKKDSVQKFRIPVGSDSGDFFKFKNMGDEIEGGFPGDLIVQVFFDETSAIQKAGRDMVYHVNLNPVKVLVGGEIIVPHPEGDIKIHIPELSSPKNSLKVNGKGFRMPQINEIGDLYINIDIKMPEKLNESEKTALKKVLEMENFKIK